MKYISKYTFITLIFIFFQFGCSSNIEKFGMNESTQIPSHRDNDPKLYLCECLKYNKEKTSCDSVIDKSCQRNLLFDLFKAIEDKNTKQVQFIVNNNSSSDIFGKKNELMLPFKYKIYQNPFHYAIALNSIDIVAIFLKSDCFTDVIKNNLIDNAEFYLITMHNHSEIFEMLLENYPTNPNKKDKKGRTLLSWLVISGYTDMVKILLEKSRTDLNEPDEDGNTPLHHAAKHGREGIVKVLLKMNDIQTEKINKDEKTPLQLTNCCNIKNILLEYNDCQCYLDLNIDDLKDSLDLNIDDLINYLNNPFVCDTNIFNNC